MRETWITRRSFFLSLSRNKLSRLCVCVTMTIMHTTRNNRSLSLYRLTDWLTEEREEEKKGKGFFRLNPECKQKEKRKEFKQNIRDCESKGEKERKKAGRRCSHFLANRPRMKKGGTNETFLTSGRWNVRSCANITKIGLQAKTERKKSKWSKSSEIE